MTGSTKKKGDTQKVKKKRDRDWFDDDLDGPPKRCETSKAASNPAEELNSNRGVGGSSRGPLPLRLFPEHKIPGNGRINTYSKPDYLLNLVEVLDGTDELDFILDSQFGKLFEIQIRKAVLSGKLVHQFLGRSLRTRKKHEIWFVYGRRPIRFSLKEFGYLTGLKCDQYPKPDPMIPPKVTVVKKDAFWYSLLGKRDHYHVSDIVDILRFDKQKPADQKMSSGRRLRLALIALVEGVLIPQSWSRPVSRECVDVAKSIDGFMAYPWGRRSFELTLEMISYRNKTNLTEQCLRDKLAASHLTSKGFIISLQLLILSTVPRLCEELPDNPKWMGNFLEAAVAEPPLQSLPQFRRFHNDNIKAFEMDEELEVVSMVGFGDALARSDFSWHDEASDLAVDNMIAKIKSGYRFVKEDWVAGASDVEVPQQSTPLRETVLGVSKTKQLTIRKLMKGKGKAVDVGSEDNILEDESRQSEKDRIFMEVRGEIFAAVDMSLAKLKSRWPDVFGAGEMSSKIKERALTIGGREKDKKIVAELFASGSGGSSTPSREIGSLVIGKRDDISEQLDEVMADLAKEEMKPEDELETVNTEKVAIAEVETNMEVQDKDKDEEVPIAEGGIETTGEGVRLNDEDQMAVETEVVDNVVASPVAAPVDEFVGEDDKIDEEVVEKREGKQIMVDEQGGAQSTNVEDIKGVDVVSSESDDETEGGQTVVDVGLANPLRSKRERKAPKKFSDDDLHIPKTAVSGEASLSSEEVETEDESMKKQFVAKLAGYRQSHYDVEGQSLPRSFFKDIYKPKNHVNSEHMEFMLSCVWRRLSTQLISQRIVILDSWFTQLLKTVHEKYNKSRRPDEPFVWNNSLCKYVAGEVGRRPGNVAWLVDVDQIYAPMHLGKNHWVALCICLREGKITIYDSNVNLHSEGKLGRLVKHLTDIMPLLVHQVAPVHASPYEPASKYEHYRAVDVSQNARGGDCGPMTVKFIELRSQGLPVDGMTDEDVDSLRMMYAMEVYREFVEPFP